MHDRRLMSHGEADSVGEKYTKLFARMVFHYGPEMGHGIGHSAI